MPGFGTGSWPRAHRMVQPRLVADYLPANSRLFLSNGAPTANLSLCYGNALVMISPPWDVVSPRVGFAGFVGRTSVGEGAVGNDVILEGAYVEVAGVKTWLVSDGATPAAVAIPSGGFYWTPETALVISANSLIRVGWATRVTATSQFQAIGGPYPVPASVYATAEGRGDFSSAGATSRLGAIAADSTGNIAVIGNNNTGFNNAPAAFIAKPKDAAAAAVARGVLIAGMSIDFGANVNQSPYALRADHHLAMGGLAYGLNDAGGGRTPWLNLAVPGTRMRDLTNAGTGAGGEAGWAMRDAMMAAVGYPWTTVLMGGPINDVSNYPLATVTANLDAALAAMKARGGRRVVMTTLRPQVTPNEDTGSPTPGAANGYAFTGGDAHQHRGGADGVHAATDAYIAALPANLDAAIDIRAANDSGAVGAWTRKWRAGSVTTTLASAALGAATGVLGGTGGASSTTLTVTAVGTGTLGFGSRVAATGIGSTGKAYILSQLTGAAGGAGTYQLSQAVTVADGAAITVAGTVVIETAAALTGGDYYAVDPQASATASESVIVETASQVAPYRAVLKAPLTKAHAVGAAVAGQRTNDGTHPTAQAMRAEGTLIDAAKGSALR